MDSMKINNRHTLSIKQVIFPTILSLLLFIILLSGYFKEKQLNQREQDYYSPISWTVKDVKISIETLIEECRFSLNLIPSIFKNQRLDNHNLDSTYQTLLNNEPYLQGIGIMDASGKIISESGITLSQNYNFSDSDWLKNSRTFGYAVSNVYSYNNDNKFFIIAVNTENGKTAYAVVNIQELTDYLKNKIKDGLILSVNAYLLEQSAGDKPYNQIQILSNNTNSFNAIQKIPDIQPEGILVELENHHSNPTYKGFVKIENTPWTLAVTLSIQKQPFLPLLLNNSLTSVILGIILLLILTDYIFILKKRNIIIAKTVKQTPIKNIETYNKKSTMGQISESKVHEINNRLKINNQNAGLLKDILDMSSEVNAAIDIKLKDKFIKLTQGILEGVDRSRKVMNRFLKFAKNIENEKLEADVFIMLQDIIDLCKEEAMYRDILIELRQGQSIRHITKGAHLAQHIFFNILSFIINDVQKDTSIIISLEQKANLFINVTFNYNKMISNTNKRTDILASKARRDDAIEQSDIKLSISREFIEKINGRMQVVAQDENGVSIILTIPI
ncbi:MAG: sensor histidine kinase [Nitrospirae bacterium]|nr:sensor histidine kinase [Nitrospirota bacterium]